ncbi:MAG TPA: bifunctional phosphopantothenoylcysteine decarboxylase/phosphopantothenate--cysteine ligase CoaBC [Longimicrobiaceae bacterium]|nr:bifunctional phosphopantothenoylcysteine decarboxylase/phosphopantothenate--cysteine ligase CoaBC [Longimicrobiaceae bacterium]
MSSSKILFILTGSIACPKACEVISRLVKSGHTVRTVATAAALRFVGTATLEGLTSQPVGTDLWEPGRAMDHIHLARWADAMIVCPATAHSLNRFAAGLADDLAGALLLAREHARPLLFVPAMNPQMWTHPATRDSVGRLRQWGARFVLPGTGRTACGETGEGRMAEPEKIMAAIDGLLARPPQRLRLLITSGATAEPIDGVRLLTNASTGYTGALLARTWTTRGHDVTLLRAQSAEPAGVGREETFGTFAELDAALVRLLAREDYDAVVHAAAVGDFAVESVRVEGQAWTPGQAKIDSSAFVSLQLRPQPKLLDSLRLSSRNPRMAVVAFKLTHGATAAETLPEIQSLFDRGADLVVHNDATRRPADPEQFPSGIHRQGHVPFLLCQTRTELAHRLEEILSAPQSSLP